MAQPRPPFDFDLNEPPPPEDDGANDASPAPVPVREPSPQVPMPPPSPVLDLEAPLSPLDEDDDDADAQPPGPPSLPTAAEPCSLASFVAPVRSPSSAEGVSGDTLGALRLPSRHGERTWPRACLPAPDGDTARRSSPETSAPHGHSRGRSETTSSHRSRHRRPYVARDDAISRHRGGYDEDAGSSHGGSRRTGPPSPHHQEQTGRIHAPAIEGQPGAPPRKRWRRRSQRQQHGFQQYHGQDQRRQGYRGNEEPQQGFRGQERPQGYQGYHGPRAHGTPSFPVQQGGYSSFRPSSGPHGREDSYHAPRGPVQEPPKIGRYRHREAPTFRPSSGAHGREDSHGDRHCPAQETPNGGYNKHREAPNFRPSSGAHGREESYGGRWNPAQEPPVANGWYQQREAPRDRGPVRPYHPYAWDANAFDRDNVGNHARHESRPGYQHRRNSKQSTSRGPAHARQYYGDVQKVNPISLPSWQLP
ncbi:uncharacterized protein LOC133884095 [Phragmites australis]|uniref:uncharacterized protein LOC133884095 n=1 Tax=Phragmites australis TaxID=29695 RepID=UPI002D795948|nr:uncharacterized protein LOC133884095 [Phragmites australis]